MSNFIYKVESPENISHDEINTFLELLILQKKVLNPSKEKLYRCKKLGLAKKDDKVVAIAAIKPKTNSDFSPDKADLLVYKKNYQWELGYCFTADGFTRQGHCSELVQKLLKVVDSENLIASTETSPENKMLGILEKNNFSKIGNTWLSQIHGGELALYSRVGLKKLRFVLG